MRTFPGSYTYILFCIIRFVTRHILRFNINSTRYIGPNYVLLLAIVHKIQITDKIEIVYCIFHKRSSINDDINLGGGDLPKGDSKLYLRTYFNMDFFNSLNRGKNFLKNYLTSTNLQSSLVTDMFYQFYPTSGIYSKLKSIPKMFNRRSFPKWISLYCFQNPNFK